MRAIAMGVGLGLLWAAGPAAAITYNFPLDGLQSVPPNATPGTGAGIVTLNDLSPAADDWELTWNVTYQDTIGTWTNSHFHGPAPYGVNAGVRVGIPNSPGGGTLIGNAIISDAFAAEVMSGLWYVNVHTTFDTGGEIRGQVVPEPTALTLLGLGALALTLRRRCA